MDVTNDKVRKDDRIFVLEVIEGKKALSSTGIVDIRLFKGGNNLHAILDKRTCLWKLALDEGILPPPLKEQFTSFDKARKHVEQYYAKRNVRVKEIID